MNNVAKKTYSIDNLKQLIDINGDTVNFEADFVVSNKEGREFEMLVVDQTTLDNSEKLDYKKVKGQISGKIRSDKNVYQNYFLILKSEKPIDLDVTINKVEIQPVESRVTLKENAPLVQKKDKVNWWFILLIVIVALLAAFLFYKFVLCKKPGSRVVVRPSFGDKVYTEIDDNSWKWENRRNRREKSRVRLNSPSSSPESSVRSNSGNEREEKPTRKMKKEMTKSPEKVPEIKSESEWQNQVTKIRERESKIEREDEIKNSPKAEKVASPERMNVEDVPLNGSNSPVKPILKPILNQRVSYNRETLLNRLKNISTLKHDSDD